ncbi:MAG: nitroreductase family protein [Anaerolineae bacterium]|nr:nitroreductase family protein [Anaerolineae bacterium]
MILRLRGVSEDIFDVHGETGQHVIAVERVGADQTHWHSFDLGQAAALLPLAAWELSVGSCIANIDEQAEGKAQLGIPQEMNFYCTISFGYRPPEHKPAQLGGRKPLEDVVRWETW